jgi:hypothetical protein
METYYDNFYEHILTFVRQKLAEQGQLENKVERMLSGAAGEKEFTEEIRGLCKRFMIENSLNSYEQIQVQEVE